MIGRLLFWRALIGCGLLIMLFQDASPSQALDFTDQILVYHEDFVGETTFPTSPEVNLLSAGAASSAGVDGNSNFFGGMGISGGVVVSSIHSEVPSAIQNFSVPSNFSSSFGMRSTFDSFSLGLAPADGQGSVGVGAAFGPFVGSPPTGAVSAEVQISRISGSTTGFVVVRYFGSSSVTLDLTFVALSAGATSAVLGGTPFTVDLAFDKTTMIATASVDIAGVGVTTAPPLDASGVATITSSTPLVATVLFAQEDLGLDFDVNGEDLLIFRPITLIGDQILIQQHSTSGGTLRSDNVIVVAGSPEVVCPGASDLCNGPFTPLLTQATYDIEAMSLSLNVGSGGGLDFFSPFSSFNGYRFLNIFSGEVITAVSLTTDIAGLTAADVSFTTDSVFVNLAGLTLFPGQFFSVELNPQPPQSVPVLSGWGVLVFATALLTFAWRRVGRRIA